MEASLAGGGVDASGLPSTGMDAGADTGSASPDAAEICVDGFDHAVSQRASSSVFPAMGCAVGAGGVGCAGLAGCEGWSPTKGVNIPVLYARDSPIHPPLEENP